MDQPGSASFSRRLACWIVAVASITSADAVFAQEKLYTLHGDNGFDQLGTDVAKAGDVNADGVTDFIAGADRDATFGSYSGLARVYSGANGSVLYTFFGDAANDQFGGRVAGAGDVDGDGWDDLIVGSRYYSLSDTSGNARVYSGRTGSVLHTFFGTVDPNFLVSPVAGVGDLDHDGFDDLLVGEAFEGTMDTGRIRVYSGANGSILYERTGATAQQMGFSVAAAGDVNQDGTPDFMAGGMQNVNINLPGRAWVYSGLDGSLLHLFVGPNSTSGFATSVSGAGDVDQDGHDDVIVGAPMDSTSAGAGGKATVFSGATGNVLHAVTGTGTNFRLGLDVSAAGDRDSDGYADFLVSLDNDYGVPAGTGSAYIHSGFDGSVLYKLASMVPNDSFGCAVSELDDLDGDGVIDYLVGGYSGDVPFQNAGVVYVLSTAGTYSNYCTSTPNSTGVAATIRGTGYATYSSDDFGMVAEHLPPGTPGLFITSRTPTQVPFGNGIRCVAPTIYRIHPGFVASANGVVTYPHFPIHASPWNFLVHPGDTWHFQYWYRDGLAGGSLSNLTDGLAVTFTP